MSLRDALEPFLLSLPAVARPKEHVHFKRKLGWTLGILVLYFVLANIPLFGMSKNSIDLFEAYRAFFAGASGSLMLLGIGPIVTASIVLQLLAGANVIKMDLSNTRDQAFFQGLQKLLVFVMIAFEALPQVLGGYIRPDGALSEVFGADAVIAMLFLQIFIGGTLIVFMDEIVSKWGIGSGVGLFIIAGVSQQIVTGLFNWTSRGGYPVGLFPRWVHFAQFGLPEGTVALLVDTGLLAFVSTVVIFLMVVYVESARIEIPLAHSSVRGARGRFPVKLIYASVLPMILVRALQANIQMLGTIIARSGSISSTSSTAGTLNTTYYTYHSIVGTYASSSTFDAATNAASGTSMTPVSGLMYYLSPVNSPNDWIPQLVAQRFAEVGAAAPNVLDILLRVGLDAVMLIVGGIIFALFWIDTTNMDAKAVAAKIQKSGLQIPGFRRSSGSIEKVMARYIPVVTVIGGAFIGILTLIASMLGTLGGAGGTGLLLTVSIMYRMYEDLASQQIMEMHPMMRTFFGKE